MAGLELTARLNLRISDFTSNLAKAADSMGVFSNRLNKSYGDANKELTKHRLGLKDTARIVQGILVSQTFYTMAGSIRDATSALMEFNEKLDYAQVTYTALFGNAELATNFTRALQEMSVETIFDYDTLANASKKMLAYGIEYENLLYIMEGLTDLGAMSGDTGALDRVAYALGQIQTTGYLAGTEMRQLANAYVPIQDIIQSSFGLSNDQMKSVGDLRLPANEVINAIVEYSKEKFGEVGDAAMMTITGLKNRVVDTMKVMGSEMMMPLTVAWKSFLVFVADGLQTIRKLYNEGGWGAIFEHLVPDKATQTTIRAFFANLHNTLLTLVAVFRMLGSAAQIVIQALMVGFNLVGPIVNNLVASVANLLNSFMQTTVGAATLRVAVLGAAGALTVLAARVAVAKVVLTIAAAINALSRALITLMTILSGRWILAGVAAVVLGIAGIAVASNNAGNSLSGLFKTLSGSGGGITQDNVFKKTTGDINDATDAADSFNNALGAGSTAADELADSMGGAGGAAKKAADAAKAGLLAFDEVFKLNEQTDSSGGGGGSGLDGIGDIDLSGLDGLGGGGLGGLLDGFAVPDFSSYAENFAAKLKGSLLGKLAAAGLGAAVAKKLNDLLKDEKLLSKLKPGQFAIIKNLAKLLTGAAVGLTFDAFASLVTDKLWTALEGALKLSDVSDVQATVGATVGSVIGGAIGLIFGKSLPAALAGSAIGHFAGGFAGLVWDEIGGALAATAGGAIIGVLKTIAWTFSGSISQIPLLLNANTFVGVFKNIGSMFKIVGLKALAKGGIIGAAIGYVVDGLAALLWNTLANAFSLGDGAKQTAKVGQTIGSVLGMVIGGLLGGPAGAVIGGAIGTFAAGFVGLFWDKITEFFKPISDTILSLAKIIVDGFAEAGYGILLWVSETVAGIVDWSSDTLSSFSGWWSDTFSGFATWLSDTAAIFSDWSSINGETLGNWASDTADRLFDWMTDTLLGFRNWIGDTASRIGNWVIDTLSRFDSWAQRTSGRFGEWGASTALAIANWAIETTAKIGQWVVDILTRFNNWALSVQDRFGTWSTNVVKVISGFVLATVQSIKDWAYDTGAEFGLWNTKVYKSVSGFVSSAITSFGNFVGKTATAIDNWISNTASSFSNWYTNTKSRFSNWWSDLGSSTSRWLDLYVWTPISNFFNVDVFWNKISGMLRSIKNKFSNWWSDIVGIFTGTISISGVTSAIGGAVKEHHATGGIFNREHIARFAEGNKAEAIIPLENATAMQPFVDAVSNGLIESLAPAMMQLTANAGNGNSSDLPPMYVGTLIADERGLKQLYKKFEVIRVQENARTGMA